MQDSQIVPQIVAREFATGMLTEMPGWRLAPEGTAQCSLDRATVAYLQHAEGALVFMHSNVRGRWHFRGLWPRGPRGEYCSAHNWLALDRNEAEPEMTASWYRPPAHVGRQFMRAMDQRVREIYAKCAARKVAMELEDGKRQEAATTLATLMGEGATVRDLGGLPCATISVLHHKPGTIDMKPLADGNVAIEGHLSFNEATLLATILAGAQ